MSYHPDFVKDYMSKNLWLSSDKVWAAGEGDIIEVVKPEYDAGRLVRLGRNRFKWPGQNFWVIECFDLKTEQKVLVSDYKKPTRIPKYRSIDD